MKLKQCLVVGFMFMFWFYVLAYIDFRKNCTNCKLFFLKNNGLLELEMVISDSFDSITLDGKNSFKKTCVLCKKD